MFSVLLDDTAMFSATMPLPMKRVWLELTYVYNYVKIRSAMSSVIRRSRMLSKLLSSLPVVVPSLPSTSYYKNQEIVQINQASKFANSPEET